MIKNIPINDNNPDWIRSLGLPNSINNKAINTEIQPINKYSDPIKTIKNIKLNNLKILNNRNCYKFDSI